MMLMKESIELNQATGMWKPSTFRLTLAEIQMSAILAF